MRRRVVLALLFVLSSVWPCLAGDERPRLFRPPVRPSIPRAAWGNNPVDAFVLAKLEAKGLAPSSPAGRLRLLRRVTVDLTGLPPTPEEQDAFLADSRPGAYRRAVERLLASPHF